MVKTFFAIILSVVLSCLLLATFLFSQQRLFDEVIYTNFVQKSIKEQRLKSGKWPSSLPDIPSKLKPTYARGFNDRIMKVHAEARPKLVVRRKDTKNFEAVLYFLWTFGETQKIKIHL